MAERGIDEANALLSSLISQQKRSDGKNWANAFEAVSVYVKRLGMEDDISKMSIIHVAGTKGKGSTCCMAESMLRAAGYKTGLYTSPHLVDVRERIRMGGAPVASDVWLKHFWWTWDRLQETATPDLGMPAYFRFMTLLGLRVFAAEGVDVAILEVGLGGRLDATNVVPSPKVCGVTSLGYDHVELLGHTLREIAGEKAGIFKAGVPAITAPQEAEAMEALQARAEAVGIPLLTPRPLEGYSVQGGVGGEIKLGLAGAHQCTNAALAVALCREWEARDAKAGGAAQRTAAGHVAQLDSGVLPSAYVSGLASAAWPGRGQVLHFGADGESPAEEGERGAGLGTSPGLSFYLDGAHTPESMITCAHWFSDVAGSGAGGGGAETRRLLLFNTMPERDPAKLMGPLSTVLRERGVLLHHAIFAPPDSLHASVTKKASDAGQGPQDIAWQRQLKVTFDRLYVPPPVPAPRAGLGVPPLPAGAVDGTGPGFGAPGSPEEAARACGGAVMPSLVAALDWVRAVARQEPRARVQVLVTGSLYLVGDVLRLLKRPPL